MVDTLSRHSVVAVKVHVASELFAATLTKWERESVCCLLVLNSVTSTQPWIRQPESAWFYSTRMRTSKPNVVETKVCVFLTVTVGDDFSGSDHVGSTVSLYPVLLKVTFSVYTSGRQRVFCQGREFCQGENRVNEGRHSDASRTSPVEKRQLVFDLIQVYVSIDWFFHEPHLDKVYKIWCAVI